jgi:hypothetical protein
VKKQVEIITSTDIIPEMAGQSTLDYALSYAARGWPVFPLHSINHRKCSCGHSKCTSPGKHPKTINGVKDATTDENQIRTWWGAGPDSNIGIATGGGLVVLDADPRHDGDLSLEKLELPSTPQVLTGGSGWHFYFKTDGAVGN